LSFAPSQQGGKQMIVESLESTRIYQLDEEQNSKAFGLHSALPLFLSRSYLFLNIADLRKDHSIDVAEKSFQWTAVGRSYDDQSCCTILEPE
jgi:hypothetical protein